MSDAEINGRADDGTDPVVEGPPDRVLDDPLVDEDDGLALVRVNPRGALEAVLMVIDEPLQEIELATALRLPVEEMRSVLAELAAEYDDQGRGFALRSVAGGWRFYSRHEFAPVVEHFLMDGQRARLTQAALETLAVIAYLQPVSRARVGAVRGVNVDGVVRTLVTRGLIGEVGVDADHGAALYGTTPYFLERLGLSSLQDLPPLAPHLPEPVGEPDAEVFDAWPGPLVSPAAGPGGPHTRAGGVT